MSCAHANIHSVGTVDMTGFLDQILKFEYADRNQFYILLQRTLLECHFEKYRVEGEKKEVSNGNKVRIAGIIFNDSQLREYISDLWGRQGGAK
jgi:hypothetical protein